MSCPCGCHKDPDDLCEQCCAGRAPVPDLSQAQASAGGLTALYESWMAEHGICTGCGCGRLKCDAYRADQRKCCPECEHE